MRKFILALLCAAALATPANADAKFEAFIQSLWPQVKAAGFSRDLFDAAFKGITDPDPTVIKLANNQPEFKSTTSEYLDKTVTPIRIDSGQDNPFAERRPSECHPGQIWCRQKDPGRHLGR